MNCHEAEQLFDAFLDDELSGALRLEFDAHRLRCRDCQQKLALLEACEHIFSRDARVPDLSEDFTERVMAQISDLGVRPRRSLPLRTLMTGAALLPAAAILLLAFVWPLGQTPRVASDAAVTGGDDALARAMQDEIALYDYVAGGIEQLWAAKNALTADAEHLRLFAVNFTLSEDVTQAAFGERRKPQPEAGDGSTRDEADESDVYSL